MRIDDLNSTPQTHEAGKTDSVRQQDRTKTNPSVPPGKGDDDASISPLAAALSPAINTSESSHSEAQLEALRLKVERGEYHVSAEDIAAGIIDRHRVS
jgi:flagellar biosynthesis anti-sigma factor FlgM